MDQPTLPEFFSTRKRPIEGVHPAKRRKLIESDSVLSETWNESKCVRINTRQRVKSTLTTKLKSKAATDKTTKARKSKHKEASQSTDILKVFLRSGMKEAAAESARAVSEVTSVLDEHACDVSHDQVKISERKRKVRVEDSTANKNISETKEESKTGGSKQSSGGANEVEKIERLGEKIESLGEKAIVRLRGRGGQSRARGNAKLYEETEEKASTERAPSESQSYLTDDSKEIELAKYKEIPKSASTCKSKALEECKASSDIQVKSPNKRPPTVRRNPGIKINPWIAEQASNVLLSRGQAALLLSQQRQAGGNDGGKLKVNGLPGQKAGVPGKGLSKTKVPEGLEKARQLIKNMRALEASASKAKEFITVERSERLHQIAASSPTKAPAHERFHSLVQPPSGSAAITLPLPYKYKVLGEMFSCCDTVLNLLGQRNETCTFDKLKDSVQKMCKKRFEKKHLAQIKFVFPMAYDIQQVCGSSKSTTFQLTIQFGPKENSSTNRPTVPMTELLVRKKNFQNVLLTITKKHHQNFLLSLETPLRVDNDKIIRWHPQLKLDDVPDIDQATLPEAPVVKIFTSAQDVLERGRGVIVPRVEMALKSIAKKYEEMPRIEVTYSSRPRDNQSVKNTSVALKGVSQDLLNKIRKKEAKKLEEQMTRDPFLDKKLTMRERLPELCRILKTYFTSEKKAAIPLEDATVKLSESYSSFLSAGQVEEHLKLLSDLVPEWLSVLTVRKCLYVKINKKTDINAIINKVMKKELN